MPPLKHALLGGSNSKRWLTCTPSARWEQEIPEGPTSEAAEEGTLAHEIAEHHLRKLSSGRPAVTPPRLAEHPLYKPSMEQYLDAYEDYVMEVYTHARLNTPDALLLLEEPVNYSDWVPDGRGTADVLIIADHTMHVIDLKYGKGVPVDAHENPQLRLYALGAFNEYRWLYPIHEIHMHICQPRLDSFTTDTMTADELLAWAEDYVKPRAVMAYKGTGEQVAGEHCTFCKAKVMCRAYADMVMSPVNLDKGPNELTDDQLAAIMAQSDKIKKWLTSISEWMLSKALSGEKQFPGFKVVQGRSNRIISDPQKALQILTDAGFSREQLTRPVSLTDMQDIVGKKKLSEHLGGLIVKPEGKPTLAPESDKRPAINTAEEASTVFKPIED